MPRYAIGDVILVHWVYEKDGYLIDRPRPAVIIDIPSHESYQAIKVTKVDRSKQFPGIWVLANSVEGKKMGITINSFIHATDQIEVRVSDIIRPIGKCPYMDKIDELLKSDSP